MSFLSRLAAYLIASTRYSALGATSGALVALGSPWIGISFETAFFLGFCLPLAPVYFYLTHPTIMRKRLITYQEWQKAGIISMTDYRDLKRQVLQWYSKRTFGKDGEEPPTQTAADDEPPVSEPD